MRQASLDDDETVGSVVQLGAPLLAVDEQQHCAAVGELAPGPLDDLEKVVGVLVADTRGRHHERGEALVAALHDEVVNVAELHVSKGGLAGEGDVLEVEAAGHVKSMI